MTIHNHSHFINNKPSSDSIMQFLDVKMDYVFKTVFGSENSKPILLNFLNVLPDFNGEVNTQYFRYFFTTTY
jgi:hypothetical protein